MSASTVSITGNPAATTRRRTVVAVEKKSTNIELVSAEPQSDKPEPAAAPVTSRDLSHHSIRGGGEPGLDRSAQTKRTGGPNSSTISPPSSRRTRKTLAAADPKPRWVTLLRIFAKNFILLLLIVGLFQIVRRLALGPGDGVAVPIAAVSDIEGRISEVEASMKSTTKMLTVQLEVVDRKIVSEVGGLRREIEKKINDKWVGFDSELKKLGAKTEGLEREVGELKKVELLSRAEFEKAYEELKKQAKSGEEGELGASLDDLRAYARNVVERELEKHAADGLGRVDYALASGGASVARHSDPYSVGKGSKWLFSNGVDAEKMLRPSFGEPGQCFPLKGSTGFVEIKLRTAIVPEAVTLEHVAKSVAYDRSSAPKDCRISGWLRAHDDGEVGTEKMFRLAEFTYDLEKSNAQTFNVLDSAVSGLVDTVRLDFTSNHGSPSHTCIYRLRVHGLEPAAVSMMAMQQS